MVEKNLSPRQRRAKHYLIGVLSVSIAVMLGGIIAAVYVHGVEALVLLLTVPLAFVVQISSPGKISVKWATAYLYRNGWPMDRAFVQAYWGYAGFVAGESTIVAATFWTCYAMRSVDEFATSSIKIFGLFAVGEFLFILALMTISWLIIQPMKE